MKYGVLIALLLVAVLATAGTQPRLQRWVDLLVDPDLGGRATGIGAEDAAAVLEDELLKLGLDPAGESGFRVTNSVVWKSRAEMVLSINGMTLAPGIEFQAASFSDSGQADGEPIFVGYGISAPALAYDDYEGFDVRGRVVVALTGNPDFMAPLSKRDEHLATLEAKSATALAKGARAILLVNDPAHHGNGRSQRPDDVYDLKPASALDGMIVIRLPHRVFDRTGTNVGLAATQLQIEQSRRPSSTLLDFSVSLEVAIERSMTDAVSLVARVPGSSGPPLLFMAHYDGLAKGSYEGPAPYVGADDNASGVAVILEAAARLKTKPTATHTVYVVLHDAEELGLLGSARTAQFLRSRGIVGSVINLDMVGRLGEEGLKVFASQERCSQMTFAGPTRCLALDASRSDHLAYARLGFPAISLSTGRGIDYHRSSDTREKLNFKGMAHVADLLEREAR